MDILPNTAIRHDKKRHSFRKKRCHFFAVFEKIDRNNAICANYTKWGVTTKENCCKCLVFRL